MSISNEQIELFQSFFKGREDIYARRWTDSDRDGYMPAYDVDWDKYEKHKALGGTFQNFKHKEPAPLTTAARFGQNHHGSGTDRPQTAAGTDRRAS